LFNYFNKFEIDTLETLRNKIGNNLLFLFFYKIFFFLFFFNESLLYIKVNDEEKKEICNNVPTFVKPISDEKFGHYLAGLIDGDGYFGKRGYLSITFFILDAPLACYIKERLNYGIISKVKDKNVVELRISPKLGVEKIIYLINGKIITENKFNQINNILNLNKFINLKENIDFTLNNSNDLDNY